MASLNKTLLIGNLGKDPDVKYVNDLPIARVSLATKRKYKDAQGNYQDETEWHRIVAFGKLAEIVEKYLKKGSLVYFEGRLRTRKYTDKEGIERYQTEIVAEQMQMLNSASTEQKTAQATQAPRRAPAQDDDPPF